MLIQTEARTPHVRAVALRLALGSVLGLCIGSAYLAGVAARPEGSAAGTTQPQAVRLAASPVLAIAAIRPQIRADGLEAAHLAAASGRATQCLAQAIYYEARGESPVGQAAVAQVVLNRLHHPAFPKSVCAVVYQRAGHACQFSFACNGAMREAVDEDAWRRARQVAARAIGGAIMRQVGAATVFQSIRVRDSGLARSLLQVAQIGAHIFYRLPNPSQTSAAPHPAPQEADSGRVHMVLAGLTTSAAPAPSATGARSGPDASIPSLAEPDEATSSAAPAL